MIEAIPECEALHPGIDPQTGAAAGDGRAQAEFSGFGEAFPHAWEGFHALVDLAFAGAACGLGGGPVEDAVGEFFQVAPGVVVGVESGADRLGVVFYGQIMAVSVKNLPPSEISDAFGVYDEAIEIKNYSANGSGHGGWRVERDGEVFSWDVPDSGRGGEFTWEFLRLKTSIRGHCGCGAGMDGRAAGILW